MKLCVFPGAPFNLLLSLSLSPYEGVLLGRITYFYVLKNELNLRDPNFLV